jgi:predicted  nucleic acid-binding Zn-ribbon protein
MGRDGTQIIEDISESVDTQDLKSLAVPLSALIASINNFSENASVGNGLDLVDKTVSLFQADTTQKYFNQLMQALKSDYAKGLVSEIINIDPRQLLKDEEKRDQAANRLFLYMTQQAAIKAFFDDPEIAFLLDNSTKEIVDCLGRGDFAQASRKYSAARQGLMSKMRENDDFKDMTDAELNDIIDDKIKDTLTKEYINQGHPPEKAAQMAERAIEDMVGFAAQNPEISSSTIDLFANMRTDLPESEVLALKELYSNGSMTLKEQLTQLRESGAPDSLLLFIELKERDLQANLEFISEKIEIEKQAIFRCTMEADDSGHCSLIVRERNKLKHELDQTKDTFKESMREIAGLKDQYEQDLIDSDRRYLIDTLNTFHEAGKELYGFPYQFEGQEQVVMALVYEGRDEHGALRYYTYDPFNYDFEDPENNEKIWLDTNDVERAMSTENHLSVIQDGGRRQRLATETTAPNSAEMDWLRNYPTWVEEASDIRKNYGPLRKQSAELLKKLETLEDKFEHLDEELLKIERERLATEENPDLTDLERQENLQEYEEKRELILNDLRTIQDDKTKLLTEISEYRKAIEHLRAAQKTYSQTLEQVAQEAEAEFNLTREELLPQLEEAGIIMMKISSSSYGDYVINHEETGEQHLFYYEHISAETGDVARRYIAGTPEMAAQLGDMGHDSIVDSVAYEHLIGLTDNASTLNPYRKFSGTVFGNDHKGGKLTKAYNKAQLDVERTLLEDKSLQAAQDAVETLEKEVEAKRSLRNGNALGSEGFDDPNSVSNGSRGTVFPGTITIGGPSRDDGLRTKLKSLGYNNLTTEQVKDLRQQLKILESPGSYGAAQHAVQAIKGILGTTEFNKVNELFKEVSPDLPNLNKRYDPKPSQSNPVADARGTTPGKPPGNRGPIKPDFKKVAGQPYKEPQPEPGMDPQPGNNPVAPGMNTTTGTV